MVERVCRGADREDRPIAIDGCCAPMDGIRCAHVGVMCGLSHQEPGQQKSAVPVRKGALRSLERFLFGGFLPAAHRPDRSDQPPWDFSVPGWQPLVSPKDIPDASTCIAEPLARCKTSGSSQCVIGEEGAGGVGSRV